MAGYLDQAKADAQLKRTQTSQIKADLTETDGAIRRLLGMVETGLMDLDDPALKERMTALKAKRTDLTRQLETASIPLPAQSPILTDAKLDRLSTSIRSALHTAPPEMRKAYIKLFVNKAVISKTEIQLSGPKQLLTKAALTDLPSTPAEVITFVREWRPQGDSNPCYRRERAVSWASRRWGLKAEALVRCSARRVKQAPHPR